MKKSRMKSGEQMTACRAMRHYFDFRRGTNGEIDKEEGLRVFMRIFHPEKREKMVDRLVRATKGKE